ncbi:MAG: PilZ domain-containing protein [Gammaproteobacteria bacterium]|nr:PilZ domain-containing protein [Gammaproteobacteria bacterium]
MAEASGSQQADDKRRYPRANVDAQTWARNPSRFVSESYDEKNSLGSPSKLTSLSFSGAKVMAPSALGTVGERVELILPTTPQGESISVIGKIVRVDRSDQGFGTAVQFARISVPDQVRLARVLSILLGVAESQEEDTVATVGSPQGQEADGGEVRQVTSEYTSRQAI